MKMNQRGQSALEYLMTYGWALIVIAIVVAVLIFVTSGATGGVTCQSSSQQIILKEWSITSATAGFTMMNSTGGNISSLAVSAASDFAIPATPPVFKNSTGTTITSATKNQVFNVTGITGPGVGTLTDASVTVGFTTEGGLAASAVIVCNGTVA